MPGKHSDMERRIKDFIKASQATQNLLASLLAKIEDKHKLLATTRSVSVQDLLNAFRVGKRNRVKVSIIRLLAFNFHLGAHT